MNDRFKDGAPDDLARLLFESADGDAPPPGARGRALAALGLSSAIATSTSAAAATPKAATMITGAAIAKWIAFGAGVAFLTVGTGAVVTQRFFASTGPASVVVAQPAFTPEPAAEAPPKAAVPEPPPAALPPPAEGAASGREARAEAIPFESLPRFSPAPAPGRRAEAASHSDLALEVESLDRVRAALASGSAPSALKELDAFAARFPSAALAPEATVLRVQALLESGNRAAAERLARRFVAASPGSPHAARVRRLIDGSSQPKARFD